MDPYRCFFQRGGQKPLVHTLQDGSDFDTLKKKKKILIKKWNNKKEEKKKKVQGFERLSMGLKGSGMERALGEGSGALWVGSIRQQAWVGVVFFNFRHFHLINALF